MTAIRGGRRDQFAGEVVGGVGEADAPARAGGAGGSLFHVPRFSSFVSQP